MTTYYYASDGDDSRTALTAQDPNTPWKFPRGFPGCSSNANLINYSPGDEILLHRGDEWQLGSADYWNMNTTSYTGADGGQIRIGSYLKDGEVGLPKPVVWKGLHFAVEDWTYDSGNIWRATLPAGSTVKRCFFGMGGQAPFATSLATVNANNPWWQDGTTLYVYDGYSYSAGTPYDPTTVLGAVWVAETDGTYPYSLRVYSGTNIDITDLEIRGGLGPAIIVMGGIDGMRRINVRDVDVTYNAGTGVHYSCYVAARTLNECTVRRVTTNSNFARSEVHLTDPTWWDVYGIGGDGVLLGNGATDIVVEDCEFIAPPHAGINIYVANNAYMPVDTVRVRGNIIRDGVNNHGRGWGCSATWADSTLDIEFSGNTVINMPTKTQVDCNNIKVHNNVFRNTRGDVPADWEGPGLTVSRRSDAYVENVDVYNNLFWNSKEIPIRVRASTGYAFGANVNIRNNVVVQDAGYQSTTGGETSPAMLLLEGDDAAAVDTVSFSHNILYSLDQASIDTPINYLGTEYALATIEAAEPTLFHDNAQVNPGLDRHYMPGAGSPCINNGVAPLSTSDLYGRVNSGNHIGPAWPRVATSKQRRST